MSRIPDDAALFEFESEEWLERLRRCEDPEALGTLGPYELLSEAGRGGQGVVYRARQLATGRIVAVKRLLAGTLATASDLRRFEREIEAAIALGHPGIVAVYGVELVGGTPLLAMEWVDGVPVTEWAAGRTRDERLRCFLEVCDAVQHAHQRGVLHRDVKPSNILVDASGRARLLDFGLARYSQGTSSITQSGTFVGTPAYAAPEQFEGAELDARADVYSLGAILFEMLTGRRLVTGEGLDAIVRAAQASEPPRPSSLARTIPLDLDAIVLQALARDCRQRYQSVDALAADLRRFMAGVPVQAHPPSAWYLLRKLAARNRVATWLSVLLVLGAVASGAAYVAIVSRNARALKTERDKALLAGESEARARGEADRHRKEAEEALALAKEQELAARTEKRNTEDVLSFFLNDVLVVTDPGTLRHEPKLRDALLAAAERVHERFRDAPLVEARVHAMLGEAFQALGAHREAEPELRAALAACSDDPTRAAEVTELEARLGAVLAEQGNDAEAQVLLLRAEECLDSRVPAEAHLLYLVVSKMAEIYAHGFLNDESERAVARLSELAGDERERLVAWQGRAALLRSTGNWRESLSLTEALYPQVIANSGADSPEMSGLLFIAGLCRRNLLDYTGAKACLQTSLEINNSVFGPEWRQNGLIMAILAEILAHEGRLEEAEELARRGLEIMRKQTSDGVELSVPVHWLSYVLWLRGKSSEAEPLAREDLALAESNLGRADPGWASRAEFLLKVILKNGKHEEAQALLDELARHPSAPSRGHLLRYRAGIERLRGDFEHAIEHYDQAVADLAAGPLDKNREFLRVTYIEFASALRKSGDEAGAVEIERQAAEALR